MPTYFVCIFGNKIFHILMMPKWPEKLKDHPRYCVQLGSQPVAGHIAARHTGGASWTGPSSPTFVLRYFSFFNGKI
jgi:hypothetical protein